MAWFDRLQDAAYTPNGGGRIAFDYDRTSFSFVRQSTAFEFPGSDGQTYVQDNGATGRRYRIDCIFWGEDYDLTADAFEIAIRTTGGGTLETPLYGRREVVPVGDISRRDEFVDGANLCIVSVVFFDTTGLAYPETATSIDDDLGALGESFIPQAAEDFARATDTATQQGRTDLAGRVRESLITIRRAIRDGLDATDEAARRFDEIEDSIQTGIDILVQEPATLAVQICRLIEAPQAALDRIENRVTAYAAIVASSVEKALGINDRAVRSLTALSACTYSAGILEFTKPERQTDAINSAEVLLGSMAQATAYDDGNPEGTSQGYSLAREAVNLAAGGLVSRSFDLRREYVVQITDERTIIDFLAEIYRDEPDSYIDEFIQDNALTGDETLQLPRGRVVRYYL